MTRFCSQTFAVVATVILACASIARADDPLLFEFESGDLATEGWKIVEGENSQPIGERDFEFHDQSVPYDKSGDRYLTTLEKQGDSNPTDDTICIMESPAFQITGDKIEFLVGGGGNRQNVRVDLAVVDKEGALTTVLTAKGRDTQKLDKVEWNVAQFKGQSALIRVVDLERGGWAHIRCDAFRIDGKLDPEADARAAKRREADAKREREKREAALKAALEKLPEEILYVRRNQYRPDHHNTATIFQKGEINEASFVGGSALVLWRPRENDEKVLLELPDGVVRDPELSFDSKKVLVSIRKSRDDDYHIAELTLDENRPTITIKADTTRDELSKINGFKQLTFVKGASDIDPLYLPSGEIVFSSTREPKYCMCNRHIMCNLHKMNADGSNIEQIGKSTLFEGHSAMLSDGRIIYDRWEYVDRNFGDAQGVWVANPDGSKHEIFWGNNTASPGGVIDARPTRDDDSVFVCTLTSCHDRPWGAIALIDRRQGIDGRTPVVQTWPPECADWVSDAPANDPFLEAVRYDTFKSVPQKFEDPFPLDDGYVLAAGQIDAGEETGLYLLDPDGGATLLRRDAPGCFDPIPVLPSDPPQTIANRVNYDDDYGYFHVTNVYEGFGMDQVEKGAVKYLRVVESPEKRQWTNADWQGSGTQAPGMAWDDFNNKRVLGEVEVQDDGSVSFAVPAEKFVYFQLLDEKHRLVQSMRSGVMARPGETNACVGCHESRIDAPLSANLAGAATAGDPQKLTRRFGEPKLFSYLEDVQPVFDQYCATCHDYGKKAGEKLILAGDRNLAFNASYWDIREKGYVRVPGAGPHNVFKPYEWGSTRSKLADVLYNGHENPDIDAKRKELGVYLDAETDPDAVLRVVEWIDINAPYYPNYGSSYRDNPYGRSPLAQAEVNRLRELTGLSQRDVTRGVYFDRPERSPILDHWGAAKALASEEYREALDIIRRGKARLDEQGRGEESALMSNDPIEIDREKRYEYFQARAQITRDARKSGARLNDLQVDAKLGDSWR